MPKAAAGLRQLITFYYDADGKTHWAPPVPRHR